MSKIAGNYGDWIFPKVSLMQSQEIIDIRVREIKNLNMPFEFSPAQGVSCGREIVERKVNSIRLAWLEQTQDTTFISPSIIAECIHSLQMQLKIQLEKAGNDPFSQSDLLAISIAKKLLAQIEKAGLMLTFPQQLMPMEASSKAEKIDSRRLLSCSHSSFFDHIGASVVGGQMPDITVSPPS